MNSIVFHKDGLLSVRGVNVGFYVEQKPRRRYERPSYLFIGDDGTSVEVPHKQWLEYHAAISWARLQDDATSDPCQS